ncbi:MAG: zinc-ribbon domain-containing protein [Lachnospiraceae bacterium]
MGENERNSVTGGTSVFTVKNILRAFSLFCIIFVFCPSFLVSCSGQNVNVSVMTAVSGVSVYDEKVVDPHPIMLVALLLPVAMLVLLLIKKFADHKTASIILGCSVIDFIIWVIFSSSVKRIAKENYCECKTTVWFVLNMIALIVIILLTALVVMKKLQLETDLVLFASGGRTQNALNQMSSAVTLMSSTVSQMAGSVVANVGNKASKENTIGFCAKCGSPIEYGCKFCTSCGTPVPESMLAEAEAARREAEEAKRAAEEAARKEAEERARLAEEEAKRKEAERQAAEVAQATQSEERPMFCQQCGAKLSPDALFCESCGTKVE